MILLIMVINLRGVKESGTTFAIPTYFFLAMMFTTLILGMVKYATGSLGAVVNPPTVEMDSHPAGYDLPHPEGFCQRHHLVDRC